MKIKVLYIVFFLLFLSIRGVSQNTDSLKQAFETVEDIQEKYRTALKLGNLCRRENPDSALKYYEEAKAIAESTNDDYKTAEVLKNIGVVYYFKEDFNESSNYYFKSLEYLNENDTGHFVLIYMLNNNLAWNYDRLGNFKQAEERYNNAIFFSKKSSSNANLALIYNNLGVLYKNMGELEKAVIAYEHSYEINQKKDNIQGQLQNLNNLSHINILRKQFSDAYKILEKALELNYELGDKIEIVNNLENLGRVYMGLKLYNPARDSLLRAKVISEEIEYSEGHKSSLLLLSEIEEILNNTDKALEYYKSYNAIQDSIYRKEQHKILIESETRFNTLKKEKENEILKQESIIADNNLRQSKLNNLLIVGGLVFVSALAILLFLLLSAKHRANTKLKSLNKKVINQKEEIENQSEELKIINEEISDRNKKLRESIEEQNRTHRQLIQSEKMASLGVLSAGIAHEINNPLNFINGGVETMMKHLETHDKKIMSELKPFTEIIDEGVSRASSIVKSLGNFSRQTVAMDELCDIHNIIDNCLVMLYNKTKNRVTIEKDLTGDDVIIYGNVGKLHQVFLNILSNAEQAIEDKGKISIKTDVGNEFVVVIVNDTGKGISDENREKVNDPFFTTKDPGEGTGLGLSITYSIIKEHKGNIELESELNTGTSFVITLPKKRS